MTAAYGVLTDATSRDEYDAKFKTPFEFTSHGDEEDGLKFWGMNFKFWHMSANGRGMRGTAMLFHISNIQPRTYIVFHLNAIFNLHVCLCTQLRISEDLK